MARVRDLAMILGRMIRVYRLSGFALLEGWSQPIARFYLDLELPLFMKVQSSTLWGWFLE